MTTDPIRRHLQGIAAAYSARARLTKSPAMQQAAAIMYEHANDAQFVELFAKSVNAAWRQIRLAR